jgi:ectoine hydroxylase-related dioxygenase (phytanoyl-CoA dioxygenase family)
VNLNPCGPNDGGLIVCKGGHVLSEQFHKDMADEPRIPAWTPEWFGFTDRGMQWLKDHGLEWVKVCAEPGDLIVWDSRTPHYNVPTQTQQDRFAVYTCFMPVSSASQEDLIRKKDAFERKSSL